MISKKDLIKISALIADTQTRLDMTVDALFEKAFSEHWSQEQYVKSGWAKEVQRNYAKNIKPHFGSKMVSQLTAAKIRDWHTRMKGTPIAANRSLEVLSRMFKFAEEKEWRPQGVNPCLLVKAHAEKKRKRFASENEIKKIGEILQRERSRHPRKVLFIEVLLLTGARPRSIERATFSQIKEVIHDGEVYGVLSFDGKNTGKNGEEESVILPPQIYESIKAQRGILNNNLIDAKNPLGLWKKIQKEINAPDLWLRDLRRTFATVGLSNGASIGAIAELLNHKSTQTTKTYAKLLETEKIKTVNTINTNINRIIKGE